MVVNYVLRKSLRKTWLNSSQKSIELKKINGDIHCHSAIIWHTALRLSWKQHLLGMTPASLPWRQAGREKKQPTAEHSANQYLRYFYSQAANNNCTHNRFCKQKRHWRSAETRKFTKFRVFFITSIIFWSGNQEFQPFRQILMLPPWATRDYWI